MRLSGFELQQATHGQWIQGMPENIEGIQSDSRHFNQGSAFIALRGPTFDGHQFAHQVVTKALALIGDHQGVKSWQALQIPQLKVADTLYALGDIAHAWRKKLKRTTIIAITGSYGKTTIRSMLAHTFNALGVKTVATHANLNNLIGVPMTLLNIEEDTDVALIECGISEIGEMQRLSEIVQPNIAVFTGITNAHTEGLGGLAGVAREKSKLLQHLQPGGWCALGCGVREQLQALPHESIETFVDWSMQGTTLRLHYQGENASLSLPLPAPHWGENMAFVISIVLQYSQQHEKGFTLTQLANILDSWQAVEGRLKNISGINGSVILDDSYNANPISMQAALHTLAAMPARRVAILGDMAELGEDAESLHSQLDVSHTDSLILVGNHMRFLHDKHVNSQWFANTNDLLKWLTMHHNYFTPNDHILVKASHSIRLDRVVKLLTEQGVCHAI